MSQFVARGMTKNKIILFGAFYNLADQLFIFELCVMNVCVCVCVCACDMPPCVCVSDSVPILRL